MNNVGFITTPGMSQIASVVNHVVNGSKRPATEMHELVGGGTFTKFTHSQQRGLEIDEDDHGDLSDDDDDDDDSPGGKKSKKTKGRVKIKMEFIENKLRRYTTFSKRKTGIMKKAYELSTLTGTQVMLLVASETGHVYTFATRKLQPMITSESGKALIQTCLNSPDPASALHSHNPDQRMSATGFEETELTYQVTEEELAKEGKTPMFTVTNVPGAGMDVPSPGVVSTQSGVPMTGTGHTYPMTTYLPTGQGGIPTAGSPNNANNTSDKSIGIGDLITQGPGYPSIIPQVGTPLQPTIVQLHPPMAKSPGVTHTAHSPHFLYRLEQPSSPSSPVVLSKVPSVSNLSVDGHASTQGSRVYTRVPQPMASNSAASAAAASPLLYHLPPGIIYATAPASLPESLLLPSYPATTTTAHTLERGNGGITPTVSTGQATTHATVPLSLKKPTETKHSTSHEGSKNLTPGDQKGTNGRSFLLPPPAKHR